MYGVTARRGSRDAVDMEFDNRWESLIDPGKATDFFALPAGLAPFDPEVRVFDVCQAWWMAEFARVIYRRDGRQEMLARAGFREEKSFRGASTQCAVVRPVDGPDFAVLVFRGTADLRNWLTNVRAVPVRWSRGGKVHRGFQRALQKVWDEVALHLDSIQAPIFYTGHSLGGALATLAASHRPPEVAYTFGSPRVGDDEFVATLTAPLFRVINRRDIVTTLPPVVPKLGFVHAGEMHHLEARDSSAADADPDLAELADPRRWFDPHESLADHAPINYLARLTRLLG